MSHARGLLTPLLVTLVGVGTGIAIFDPAFKQEKEQKEQEQIVEVKDPHEHAPSPESQIRKTEEAVANAGGTTTIPNDAERWSKVQSGQFSKPVDTFEWSEVKLDQYSTTGKKSS